MRTAESPQINGAAVRALREALDIGQGQMARDLGITPSFLYRIEHGDRGCRASLLRAIAAYLAVTPMAIIRSEDDAA
jgi:transcriptional regulator with XRE-family HTH domain